MPYEDDDERGSRASRIARKYRAAFRKKSKELAQRDTLLDEFVAEHEELLESHNATKAELDGIKASKTTEAHRAEFDKQARKANVDPEYLDDLFRLADLDLDEEEPDPKDIAQAIRDAVKKRPYMIAQAKKKGKDAEEEETDDDEDEDDSEDDDSDVDDLADDEQDDEAPVAKPAKNAKAEADLSKEVKLGKGEGAGRGSRASLKPPSPDEQIDADFAATGRTDAFRI